VPTDVRRSIRWDRDTLRRRLTLAAALSALFVALLPGLARAQQGEHPTPPRPKNGQITLLNATDDSVRVELRIGDAADCSQNPIAAVKLIPPGRSWLIAALHPVCWRRSSPSRAAGKEWNPWQRNALAVGERKVVRL
jgi:hypothetical protein